MTISLYGTRYCSYCVAARQLLQRRQLAFADIYIDQDAQLRQQVRERSRRYTVPQIWIDDEHVGGYRELLEWDRSGKLHALALQRGRPEPPVPNDTIHFHMTQNK